MVFVPAQRRVAERAAVGVEILSHFHSTHNVEFGLDCCDFNDQVWLLMLPHSMYTAQQPGEVVIELNIAPPLTPCALTSVDLATKHGIPSSRGRLIAG